jgi:hypothetical protein
MSSFHIARRLHVTDLRTRCITRVQNSSQLAMPTKASSGNVSKVYTQLSQAFSCETGNSRREARTAAVGCGGIPYPSNTLSLSTISR